MPGPEWIITAPELERVIDQVTLLDVREPEEVAESRIEGKVMFIPLGELMVRVEKEVPKDKPVVVYCAHGVRSMHALMAMARMGYSNLKSLDGGICAWEDHRARPRG